MYDTETAKLVGCDDYSTPYYSCHCHEALYRKKSGEYFLFWVVRPMTRDNNVIDNNTWSGSAAIFAMNFDGAREWAESHLDEDECIDEFGEPDEW